MSDLKRINNIKRTALFAYKERETNNQNIQNARKQNLAKDKGEQLLRAIPIFQTISSSAKNRSPQIQRNIEYY